MEDGNFDVVILGCGPAGFYSALSCAGRGYRTLVVENEVPGGTGFRWGALPVKGGLDLIRKNSGCPADILGLQDGFKKLIMRAADVEELIRRKLGIAGVALVTGVPEIISPRMIRIDTGVEHDFHISCRYLVIATGTSPSAPPGFEIDGDFCISHRELLFRETFPERLEILGGNVEGIELAFLYAGIGIPVRITEMEDGILPENDSDLIAPLKTAMETMGVDFRTGFKALSPADISKDLSEAAPLLLTGFRKPNIPRGLENLNPELLNGFIKVGKNLESSISGVFAVGDVNGIQGMANIAIHQGIHLPKGFVGGSAAGDYSLLPRSVFTVPEIAGAGLQECELDNPEDYQIVKIPLSETWRGFIRKEEGFLKLIFQNNGELAGIWGVGTNISELLSAAGLLLKKKISAEEIIESLFIHPTISEGILEAAMKTFH